MNIIETMNRKKQIYNFLNKIKIVKLVKSLDDQKTNLMPIHDLKSILEIEIMKQLLKSTGESTMGTTRETMGSTRGTGGATRGTTRGTTGDTTARTTTDSTRDTTRETTRDNLMIESDVFSLSTDPIEFYFAFFNQLNGHYATAATAQQTKSPLSVSATNLLKLPKSPIHYIEMDCTRELVQFLLQIDVSQFTSGLTFLCKSLVEDVVVLSSQASALLKPKDSSADPNILTRLASCIANQLLIQVIAMAFPDMFFGRNEKDAPDSPAKQVFSHYQKHLASGKGVGNALLWICCQQSFSLANGRRVVHPKCLEIWFAHFFPLLAANNKNTWDKKNAMSFVDVVLDNLIKQPATVQYDSMDLAVIPMSTFTSLFNFVFLQPQSLSRPQTQALEKIYRKLKHLMFTSDRAKILTSPPPQILTAFLAPLSQLDKESGAGRECIDLLVSLFASLQLIPGSETGVRLCCATVDAWVACFADYSKETAVLVECLIEKSRPETYWGCDSVVWSKIRSCGLSEGLEKMATRNKHLVRSFRKSQPHLGKLQARFKVLAKLSRPRPTLGTQILNISMYAVWLLGAVFMVYALVYVQCEQDSLRVCPLPFDPHVAMATLKTRIDAGVAGLDAVGRYVEAMMRPVLDTLVRRVDEVVRRGVEVTANVWRNVPTDVTDIIDALWEYFSVCVGWIRSVVAQVGTRWGEFQTQVWPLVDVYIRSHWHSASVLFVDVYLPAFYIWFYAGLEVVGVYGRLVVEYLTELLESPLAQEIKSHWASVYVFEQYQIHLRPLLQQAYLLVMHFYRLILEAIADFDWK